MVRQERRNDGKNYVMKLSSFLMAFSALMISELINKSSALSISPEIQKQVLRLVEPKVLGAQDETLRIFARNLQTTNATIGDIIGDKVTDLVAANVTDIVANVTDAMECIGAEIDMTYELMNGDLGDIVSNSEMMDYEKLAELNSNATVELFSSIVIPTMEDESINKFESRCEEIDGYYYYDTALFGCQSDSDPSEDAILYVIPVLPVCIPNSCIPANESAYFIKQVDLMFGNFNGNNCSVAYAVIPDELTAALTRIGVVLFVVFIVLSVLICICIFSCCCFRKS